MAAPVRAGRAGPERSELRGQARAGTCWRLTARLPGKSGATRRRAAAPPLLSAPLRAARAWEAAPPRRGMIRRWFRHRRIRGALARKLPAPAMAVESLAIDGTALSRDELGSQASRGAEGEPPRRQPNARPRPRAGARLASSVALESPGATALRGGRGRSWLAVARAWCFRALAHVCVCLVEAGSASWPRARPARPPRPSQGFSTSPLFDALAGTGGDAPARPGEARRGRREPSRGGETRQRSTSG
jgi:hypothetical protein